jgi:ABC-type uncharacterized transport system substrate-binding protein
MDRRTFVSSMTFGLLAAPLAAEAQPLSKVSRIGVLEANRSPGRDAFDEGLRQLGYVEGHHIAVEPRWAGERAERFPELAAELVGLKVDVIVATNNPAVAATQKATTTIPVVMVLVTDPVRLGFVSSLARPAGNITGLTIRSLELAGKRLALLKETVPNLTRVAVLWDPIERGRRQLVKETEVVAPKLGLQIQSLEARDVRGLPGTFTAMMRGSSCRTG